MTRNQRSKEWTLVSPLENEGNREKLGENSFHQSTEMKEERKMMKKKGRLICVDLVKKITTALFYIGCAIGCYIQIHSVTVSYLSYSSVTEVTVEIPKELDAPALSICFRYVPDEKLVE